MGLNGIGNGVFVDSDPVDTSDVTEIIKEMDIPGGSLNGWNFYPYVEFSSLERAYGGFVLAKKPPKKSQHHDHGRHIYGTLDRPTTWENSIAPLLDFNDALSELKDERRHRNLFEIVSLVEVIDRKAYQMLLEGEYQVLGPKDWVPGKSRKALDWSEWKGPGVYDMREVPPQRSHRSVEEYEQESMEEEAKQVIDEMFQGDEWKELVETMIEDNREEILE